MTAIKGTNGNDNLIGTDHADRFTPLLGFDYVDGRGGSDILAVDYSSITTAGGFGVSYIFDNGGEAAGYFNSADGSSSVFFERIETISAKLDAGNNVLLVEGSALALGLSLDVDGGAGHDRLQMHLVALTGDVTLEVQVNGKVSSNLGEFSGFEDYDLTLGAGNHVITTGGGQDYIVDEGGHAVINTGAGADLIISRASVDTIDGGADFDVWIGEYGGETASLTFTFGGSMSELSNGTMLTNVEQFNLMTGSGDDVFNLDTTIGGPAHAYIQAGQGNDDFHLSGNVQSIFDGGEGWDSALIDFSHAGIAQVEVFGSAGDLHGQIITNDDADAYFDGIENIEMSLGDGYSNVQVGDLGQGSGGSVFIDAGGGYDWLDINLLDVGDAVFEADNSGNATTNAGASFTGFEDYAVWVGGSNNVVITASGNDRVSSFFGGSSIINTGAGDDIIESWQGLDTVDGGDGYDSWAGEYQGNNDDLTFALGQADPEADVSIVNVEQIQLNGGDGNDVMDVSGDLYAILYGGGGSDELSLDYSSASEDAEAQIFGGYTGLHGWLVTGPANITYDEIESVDMRLGAGSDLVMVGSLEQAPGSAIFVDAGDGRDRLDINLLDFGDVVFEADDSGNVTSNTGATFANFEDYTVWVGASNNVVTTASGDDQVYSYFGGSSIINTGGGDDYIESLLSTDSVNGGDGYDSWSGEYEGAYDGMSFVLGEEDPDADVSVAYVEQVQLNAGSGDDVMDVSGDLYAILYGGGGSDLLSLDYASDSEDAEAEIFGGNGSLHGWLVTGAANITYDAVESVEMRLGAGSDRVNVGLLEESGGSAIFVDAGEGRDRLDVNLLNYGDVVFEADDSGNVTTNTGATFANFEDYTIWLGAANNVVTSGSGDDQITSYFGGTNVISTGAGSDTVNIALFASAPGASLTADGGDGNDQMNLDLSDATGPIEITIDETGITTPDLDIAVSNFEHYSLILGTSDDVINLGAISATVDAGEGNDVINGGSTSTWLEGGEGDDVIAGGDGFDFLVGGAGADRFVFQDGADEFVIDFVWDFSSSQGDIMDLVGIDADVNSDGDQAFSFIGNGAFTGTAGELRLGEFVPGQVTVEGDMNGDGVAELWINVGTFTNLSASDFFL